MPAVWSKLPRFVDGSKLLANVAYIDDLQNSLIDIESCSNPDDFKAVTELFALYIEKKVSAAAGRPIWVCTFAFNGNLGSSWPEDCYNADCHGGLACPCGSNPSLRLQPEPESEEPEAEA